MPSSAEQKFDNVMSHVQLSYPSIPPWSVLSTLGQSRALRTSYLWLLLVPIVAHWVSSVDQIDVPFFGFAIKPSLPFSWKVFYFSSVCFGLASLLYSLACPKFIQKYQNYGEFQSSSGSGHELLRTLGIHLLASSYEPGDRDRIAIDFLRRFVVVPGLDDDEEYYGREDKIPYSLAHLFEGHVANGKLPDSFHYILAEFDRTKLVVRGIILVLYLAGFALLAYVLVQNFWFVVKATINR